MAHLNEKNQIVGGLGNLIFRVVNGKIVVQTRPDYSQVKQTQSTQKAASDFGKASQVAKKISYGCQQIIQGYHSPEMATRLRSKVLQAMRTHASLPLGRKDLWSGTPELLEGFEFNKHSPYKDNSELWTLNWELDSQRRIHFKQKAFTPKNHLYWLPRAESLQICYWICAFQKKDYKPCQQQLLTLTVSPDFVEVPMQNFESEVFPEGCLIIICVSMFYYRSDAIIGGNLLNHKKFHPARILKIVKT
ncbi:hypothetical protein [Mesonia aestuariivivens]|uniref:Uncharacterized protein n=1 Tax=Mesonia aestuariivivens TaxID=2796128 RepID=A0ABS6W723_9FLAO|nr:hypothetical protein [Mesonia aestuariivivens]MBW2962923.1 hypothetical protein [Mesonia aestuariivivens]